MICGSISCSIAPHPSTRPTWRSLWKATGLKLAVFQGVGLQLTRVNLLCPTGLESTWACANSIFHERQSCISCFAWGFGGLQAFSVPGGFRTFGVQGNSASGKGRRIPKITEKFVMNRSRDAEVANGRLMTTSDPKALVLSNPFKFLKPWWLKTHEPRGPKSSKQQYQPPNSEAPQLTREARNPSTLSRP